MRLLHADDINRRGPLFAHDRLMYCMGNSEFHGYVYEVARQRGVVVAHDVRLTGFYGWYSGKEWPEIPRDGWPNGSAHVRHAYRRAGLRRPGSLPEQQAALGLFMTQEIQLRAERLLVHSRFAADILRLDRPAEHREHAPITVLPHALEPRPPRRRDVDPAVRR